MFDLGVISRLSPVLVFGILTAVQFLLAVYIFFSLRLAARERAAQTKEMYGMMKKIEGLSAGRREQILVQFDHMLETLSVRLPTSVASKASELVFEMERQVLARLAELEPSLKEDPAAREKMEGLICSMENLEESMVAISADTVHQVMMESRRTLFEEEGLPLSPQRPLPQ